MSGEPRRSVRSNRGVHSKHLEEETTPAPPPKKGKGSKKRAAEQTPEEEEEDADALIRCVCGHQEDDGGRMMICCENCSAWQHNDCMGQPEEEDKLPEQYYCEQCRPEDHKELLEAMARGEKPWEKRAQDRAAERKPKKGRKGGKKGARGGRQSKANDMKPDATPQPSVDRGIPAAAAASPQERGVKRRLDTEEIAHAAVGALEDVNQNSPAEEPAAAAVQTPRPSVATRQSQSILPDAKRRKSSTGANISARRASKATGLDTALAENIDQLPENRRAIAKALHTTLAAQIRGAAQNGSYRIPDGETADSLGTQFALLVEYSLYMNHTDAGELVAQYSQQARSILFNVKKNPTLLTRLLTKSLTPDELSLMSSDEMASEELQKQMALMKEQADKQAILHQEDGPRVRKTHKGEEYIDDGANNTTESVFTAPPVRNRELAPDNEEANGEEGRRSPMEIELPENIDTRQPLSVDTSAAVDSATERKPSAAFNIQNVWSSVHSPDNEQQRTQRHLPQRQSIAKADDNQGPGVDADVDRMLKEEDNESEPYSPTEYPVDPSAVWTGKMTMKNVGEFMASAHYVAGGDLPTKQIPWSMIIPSYLCIDHRLEIEKANEYLCGLRFSHTSDVSVLTLTPLGGASARREFNAIFEYFHKRQRYGVMAQSAHESVKDTYFIPVEDGSEPLPDFLQILADNTIGNDRPDRLLLVTFVTRTQPSANATPQQHGEMSQSFAASPPPHNGSHYSQPPPPHGMQGTPITPFNPGPMGNNNFSHQPPPSYGSPYSAPPAEAALPVDASRELAGRILGPQLVTAPVVEQLLNQAAASNTQWTENLLLNLKAILETVPQARDNMQVLMEQLGRGSSQ